MNSAFTSTAPHLWGVDDGHRLPGSSLIKRAGHGACPPQAGLGLQSLPCPPQAGTGRALGRTQQTISRQETQARSQLKPVFLRYRLCSHGKLQAAHLGGGGRLGRALMGRTERGKAVRARAHRCLFQGLRQVWKGPGDTAAEGPAWAGRAGGQPPLSSRRWCQSAEIMEQLRF